jgi:periplasmic protein TonB
VSGSRDLRMAFALAMLAHGLLAAVVVAPFSPPALELEPLFQAGDTCVAVSFVPATPPVEAAPVPPPRVEPPPDPNPAPEPQPVLPPPPEPAPEPEPEPELEPEPPPEPDREPVIDRAAAPEPVPAAPPPPAVAFETKPDAPVAPAEQAPEAGDARQKGVLALTEADLDVRPHYPLGARMRGEEGTVALRVAVNDAGRATRVAVERTSGFPSLDEAAESAVRKATFVARGTARTLSGEVSLCIRFELVN